MILIGRPGLYEDWITPDGLLRIKGWARDGLTEEKIAKECIGVGYTTFREWKSRFPALAAALKKGKEPADIEIEDALYKSAHGYTVTETVEEIYTSGEKGPDGQYKVTGRHIRKITREVPPNVTAIIYWLNNRKPEKWRNRKAAEPEQESAALTEAKKILGGVQSAID